MRFESFSLFISVGFLSLSCDLVTASKQGSEKIILDSIFKNYDSHIRPSGTDNDGNGPVKVRINVFVRSVDEINDVAMNFKVQLTVRLQWNDDRLMFDDFGGKFKYINLHHTATIWVPDLFFANEITGHVHDVLAPNILTRIYPNGDVLYSTRLSLTLSCGMNLKSFPMDFQSCSIIFVPYAYTTEDQIFLWREYDSVAVIKNIKLPEYTYQKHFAGYCTSKTNTGSYSCLRLDLVFKREAQSYIRTVYIPNTMLIVLAWISFWIPLKAGLVRTAVSFGSLMALSWHIAFINGISLPLVSYTKAIDIWTESCLTFVFFAFVEFIIVYCLWLHKQRCNPSSDFEMKRLMNSGNAVHSREYSNKIMNYWMHSDWTHRIDVIFRILYPVSFGIFNIYYWTKYLTANSE